MTRTKSILKFEIISTIFIIILGFILHFTFELSNQNPLIGTFSAVNESIWEHLKLLFFPMTITTIVGYFYFQGEVSNYLCTKTKGILLALAWIIIFYYTYSGILGTNIAIIDIGSFVVATILGEFYTYQKINLTTSCNKSIFILILLLLSACFIIFTFSPPHIGIFQDPSTKLFGIHNQ